MADKTAPVMTELERIQAELLQLDLEEKRESAARRRSNREERSRRARDIEAGLEQARAEQRLREQACPHRKAGTDLEGLFVGNDTNHSVIKHILPDGAHIVVCQRCQSIWERPVREEYDSPVAYRAAVERYRDAVAMPTDNTTSGSQLFTVERVAA